jgi:hypothetical protein
MEAACREVVLFMAISGDSAPHYSTLASFVSGLGEALVKVFAQVLTICERQGLIGRELFAIDGVKLPSNASKAKSGKREDFERQLAKMEKAVERMLAQHRDNDAGAADPGLRAREQRYIERLNKEAAKIGEWLKRHSPGSPQCQGQAAAVEPHRQRIGQDAHRQGRGAGLHRGGGGRREAPDHPRSAGPRQRLGARVADAGDCGDRADGRRAHRGV